MIRIVVTGSECTGKTTLVKALAEIHKTQWVPEYVRQVVANLGRAPEYGDVESIARGQIALEEKMARIAGDLLFLDTDLVSTYVYSHHYYGDCPTWIGETLDERAADLYLLAGIDVPWVADGQQRDRGDRREEMQSLFRDELTRRDLRFSELLGSQSERLRLASLLVAELT